MQRALRPYATAGVAVLGTSLIYVTPLAAPHLAPPAVQFAAAETLSELVGSLDAGFNTVTGAGEAALASAIDTLPIVAGFSEASAGSAVDEPTLELLDPAFWQLFWDDLLNPDAGSAAWLLLMGAVEQLPVIGPLLQGFGLFLFPAALLFGAVWYYVSQLFDFEPSAAAADAVPAGVSAALGDVALLFGDAGVLDLGALASSLDLTPVTEIGAAFDPAGMGDIATALSTSVIPDLGEILTSLIP